MGGKGGKIEKTQKMLIKRKNHKKNMLVFPTIQAKFLNWWLPVSFFGFLLLPWPIQPLPVLKPLLKAKGAHPDRKATVYI